MTLQTILAEKLAERDFSELARELGYSSADKLISRTNKVINSAYLGLDSGGFDFRYSTPELIKRLCTTLGIPALLCDKVIAEVQAELSAKRSQFKPYIFVETGFKRTSQSVLVLAALQNRRYIEIPQNIQSLSLNDQVGAVQALITHSYRKHPSLELWGDVQQYVYFYDEQTVITFSTAGVVLDVVTEYFYPTATLKI